MFDFSSRAASSLSQLEKREVISLIESQSLFFEEGADFTALVKDADGGLAATASLFGNVIRMVAVSGEHRESGLSAVAISSLIEASRAAGISRLFLYTKPEAAVHFASLGFRNIAETDAVSLLEIGEPGIGAYREYLAENRVSQRDGEKAGAIVVNCNPFTLGHRYLIERALERCALLYVIVVEADLSCFSFADRFAMVKDGVSDLEAAGVVKVIRSGEYAISSATFSTYFLKDRAELPAARQQSKLDINLFIRLFVPALGIEARFFGREPSSSVTAVYNEEMLAALPQAGVEAVEIERETAPGRGFISASRVREMLSSKDTAELGLYLPESTISYLRRELSLEL